MKKALALTLCVLTVFALFMCSCQKIPERVIISSGGAMFSYSTDPDFVFYMDGVDNKKQTVIVNGYPGEIFITLSEEETNAIVWSDNSVPVIFTFTADCDAETLLKVAENIKVVEE